MKFAKVFGGYVRLDHVARVEFDTPTRVAITMVYGGTPIRCDVSAAQEVLDGLGINAPDDLHPAPGSTSQLKNA